MAMNLVLDMETNGIGSMRPPQQTITQIGWILFDDQGNTKGSGNDIVMGATEVNRIYDNSLTLDEIIEFGIPLGEAFEKMSKVIDSDTTIYAHNADFDLGLLKYAKLSLPTSKIICTMKNGVDFCKLPKTGFASRHKGYKWPKLSELANKLNIILENGKLHDALYDCEITKECVLKGKEIGIF